MNKSKLVVLDFDGFLLNSYYLLKLTFLHFGLNIGDEERFQHRRKFLKYMGGGKELLRNLVLYSLPKKKKIRQILTEIYVEEARIFKQFVPLLNNMIQEPDIHLGIVSRNYTLNPGETIRKVLKNSDVDEQYLDFVIPVPTGTKKHGILQGMKSTRFACCYFGADEIGDYHAAHDTGYDQILMASYGFDNKKRLISKGNVPESIILDTPDEIVFMMQKELVPDPGSKFLEPPRSSAKVVAASVINP